MLLVAEKRIRRGICHAIMKYTDMQKKKKKRKTKKKKKKKNGWSKFETNGPKSGPILGFLSFFQVWFIKCPANCIG